MTFESTGTGSSGPVYVVRRAGKAWAVERTDVSAKPTRIGALTSKREARRIAGLLAGWRGRVEVA